MNTILIVDDEKSVRYSFKKILNNKDYILLEADNFESAIAIFSQKKPDLALVDIEMPGKSGIDLLQTMKQISPSTPVIVVTAYGTGDRVIRAMKYGAYEYIEKPFDVLYLIKTIEDAIQSTKSTLIPEFVPNERNTDKSDNQSGIESERIIGESPAIKDVFKLIGRVAVSDASILVTGESGTGKELVAKAIHRYSDRAIQPFIAVNCAAIPETLLESELFGYTKGAFTGAIKDKPGKFEEASGGTIFLDEIGDMGLMLQSKILRVLQEGTLERLGSLKSIHVNVRIITATNRNLEQLIVKKLFREDLYYRIRVITIALPPLRMRQSDIPLLANYFIAKHIHQSRKDKVGLSNEALEFLISYSWPGNIRELENTIKRALVLAKGNIIAAELITDVCIQTDLQTSNISEPLESYLTDEMAGQEGQIFELVTKALEKDLIKWALNRTGFNQLKAAKLLGISRVMLHERMERFELS